MLLKSSVSGFTSQILTIESPIKKSINLKKFASKLKFASMVFIHSSPISIFISTEISPPGPIEVSAGSKYKEDARDSKGIKITKSIIENNIFNQNFLKAIYLIFKN